MSESQALASDRHPNLAGRLFGEMPRPGKRRIAREAPVQARNHLRRLQIGLSTAN